MLNGSAFSFGLTLAGFEVIERTLNKVGKTIGYAYFCLSKIKFN